MNFLDTLSPALVIGGLLLATSIVWGPALYFGLRQERRKRDQEHEERLRALELGYAPSTEPTWWTPPRLAAAIGVFVPLGAAAIAMIATLGTNSDWFPLVIWPASGAVGVTGVIGGTVLASRLGMTDTTPTYHPNAHPAAKPAWHDPESFDAVTHRRGC